MYLAPLILNRVKGIFLLKLKTLAYMRGKRTRNRFLKNGVIAAREQQPLCLLHRFQTI